MFNTFYKRWMIKYFFAASRLVKYNYLLESQIY